MATVTFIPEAKQTVSALRGLIRYCLQDHKVRDTSTDRRLVGGVNCNGENAFTEFMTTKNTYRKNTGTRFYQYVQSFSPRENVTPEEAHRIGLEFAARAWPGHEVLVTTHCDANHIHTHFVINSVNYENGYKLREHPGSLIRHRALSDEICRQHGLTTLTRYTGGGTKVSSREYRAAAKGESWKFRLMSDIDAVMNKCGSRKEFLSEMRTRGYEITWTEERKYITFTCPNGRKCRDKTLHNEKYLKENLEYELRYREQHYRRRKRFAGEPDQEKRTGNRRDAKGHHAGHGSGSRKGLGYHGEPVAGGSGVSAGGVQADGTASDRIEDAFDDGSVVGQGAGTLQDDAEGDDRQAERPADSSREPSAADEEPRTTGWEPSRRNYERYLGIGQGAGESHRQRVGEDRTEQVVDPHGDHGRSIGIGGSTVNSALRALAGVTDGGEDPEERRKRIEAEQNGSDLGAVIGLATGLLSAAWDGGSDELPEELEEEQNEIKMN